MTLEGPPEKTPEAKEVVSKKGFSCGNVLGELVFAHAMCHLIVGHSVCLLAHFSDHPHEEKFDAFKGICKCPRRAKSWGIMFHHPHPLIALPDVHFAFLDSWKKIPIFLLSPFSSKMS